jgi:hypothetical protein
MSEAGGSEPATDLFDRWLAHHEGRTPEPEPPTAEPAVAAPQPAPAPAVPEQRAALPHTIFFKPRRGTQRLLGLLLLGFLALTVAAAVWAWHDRTYLSYGIAAVAAAVTTIIWATRASAGPTRLTLRGSELEIVRNGSRALFDLAASHTPIEMHGEPGDRRWKVLILRRSMSPYVIDAAMVDPAQFTRVLRYYRPEV